MKTRTLFVALAFLLPAALLQEHAAADTTFADGTFNNSDWSLTLQTSGNGGTSNATQVISGGNPGSYYRVYIQSNGIPATVVDPGRRRFTSTITLTSLLQAKEPLRASTSLLILARSVEQHLLKWRSCKMETSTLLTNTIPPPARGPIFPSCYLPRPILV